MIGHTLHAVAHSPSLKVPGAFLDSSVTKVRLRDRAIRQMTNLLDWSPVDKSLLIAVMTAVFVTFIVIISQPLLNDPEQAAYMNKPNTALFMKTLLAMNVVWAAIMVWGFSIRRSDPDNRGVVVATLSFYACTYGLGAYVTGPLTSPYAGLVFVGGTFVAMLLFEIRDAMIGVVIGSVIIAGTTVAERLEYIPYAPLMDTSPFEHGRLATPWFISMGGAFLFIMIQCIVLCAYIVKRWRDREEALAEAYILLKDSKDRLVRAEALASLGSLVTGAAHELRNPLASSGSILQSLGEEIDSSVTLTPDDKTAAAGMLELALKGHRRASLIVNRLYEFAENLEQEAPNTTAGSVIDQLREKFPRLQIDCTPEAARRTVSGKRMFLLLSNLAENALQSGADEPPSLAVTARGNQLEFELIDSGRGIAPELQADLFKPFYTLEKGGEGHGVGLGLYIVHELVTRGGGSVQLDSEPGRGTRVTVRV